MLETNLYRLEVNGHTYLSDRAYIDNAIKIGKEAMKGKHAIIAVEKGGIVILLSQPHKTAKEQGKTKQEYINMGFTVYTA